MSRLMAPRRKDGTFPFAYRNSASTDIRETFARFRTQPAQPVVRQITQQKARKA